LVAGHGYLHDVLTAPSLLKSNCRYGLSAAMVYQP